jgi:hypothetical protein
MQPVLHDINYLVFEQLLYADMRDMVVKGCFAGIDFQNKGVLDGSYIVQVCMYVCTYVCMYVVCVYVCS